MMSQFNARRFEDAVSKYETGNYSQALEGLHALRLDITDPWDRAEVLYHETITLVVLHKISEARQRALELNQTVTSLITAPLDGYEYDLQISLPVMARHAEIRVNVEEGNSQEALTLLDDLLSRYPKQLSITEFRTVSKELRALHGMLLGDVGLWEQAKPLLESTSPPESWKGVHTYYIGQCYYELGINETAKMKLLEALTFDLPSSIESQAHYILGLTEYNLSNVAAAKHQLELCAKKANEKDIDMAKLWAWLESSSRTLGQFEEAERYHRLRIDSTPKRVN